MYEIYKKEIKTSLYAPNGYISASSIWEKIKKDMDYVGADTVLSFENSADAFKAFAKMKNTVIFLPQKMRGYEEISVVIFCLYNTGHIETTGTGYEEETFTVGDAELFAQFSENVYCRKQIS